MTTYWNRSYILTARQKSIIVAILLTDGWLSQGKNDKTPLVGLQLCDSNKSLLLFVMFELRQLIRDPNPKSRLRGAPGSASDARFLQCSYCQSSRTFAVCNCF